MMRLDEILKMFESVKTNGKIPRANLLNDEEAPDDWHRAIGFLVDEGYLKEFPDYFEITYKGQGMLHAGGFVAQERKERIIGYCTIVAAVSGVLGFLVALVALIFQIFGD